MKKAAVFAALLLAAAQPPPAPKLAAIMPSGALLYLETPNLGRLLRDWNASAVKADWLKSANYDVFAQSNLFTKLQEVYNQYGAAAGFLPGWQGAGEIAGGESALALYGIRDVEFLYVTRIADGDLMKSQLWAVRDKFQQRQAGGLPFYWRRDAQSQRTVAFAFTNGLLLLATRDDLMAQALELLAGRANPNIAADRWYHDAVASASAAGELRLVMNLESLVKSTYFRSYWVQRNASGVRGYWTGVADVRRTAGAITETRVFLRAPDAAVPAGGDGAVSKLAALVPPDAGLYKAARSGDSAQLAGLIVHKLIGPQPVVADDWRTAPMAASPDVAAGSEADLETRIDELPLPADAGISDSIAMVRAMIEKSGGRAALLVQSSAGAGGTFVRTPAVIVIDGDQDWDLAAVRGSLTGAAGKLWTTSQLGAGWIGTTAGRHAVERMDGLGTLFAVGSGKLLFLSNDSGLLAAVLDRTGMAAPAGELTYAAGFRHLRERANYERLMSALDFSTPGGSGQADSPDSAHAFFSGNLGSLSRVLSGVVEVGVTEADRGSVTLQTVVYRTGGQN